jgi:hypothetical protein
MKRSIGVAIVVALIALVSAPSIWWNYQRKKVAQLFHQVRIGMTYDDVQRLVATRRISVSNSPCFVDRDDCHTINFHRSDPSVLRFIGKPDRNFVDGELRFENGRLAESLLSVGRGRNTVHVREAEGCIKGASTDALGDTIILCGASSPQLRDAAYKKSIDAVKSF